MAAALIVANLRGGATEREAAYTELFRREAEHNANGGSGSGSAASSGAPAVRASPEELQALSWSALRARALVEEHTEEDVEAAMDDAEPKAALVQLLLSQKQDLESLAAIGVACASPLCEVLCKAVAEVGVAEYLRASQILTALSGVEPEGMGGECYKPDQCNICTALAAPDSALHMLVTKDPAKLTAEDALAVACLHGALAVQYSTSLGIDAAVHAAGLTFTEAMGQRE
jgi:hypothetical protein